MLKFNDIGEYIWTRVSKSEKSNLGNDIVYNPFNNEILITGEFSGQIHFGSFSSTDSSENSIYLSSINTHILKLPSNDI